ncbi:MULTISPECIES: hypothetical protein [unclassified Bradyrhizobium]|uniref:hypothetical protein n=1 Tax=unclassified Bradyrhizobium TaxID=2631580 RepID=UPI0029166543|nr:MULTISPECIES: hypothetical protein [unclassified Bradyrhizobium]
MSTIRLIGHQESFEVRYDDGRPSAYFYFDDKNPLRRQLQGIYTKDNALKAARALARQERDARPSPELLCAWKVVEDWKQTHNLNFLSPRMAEDLAQRIEHALLTLRS